jgi:hypothetical protein
MPFTLAHPAIIIPLRRFLPLSALVIGSLSPDFEYLFRLTAISKFSHTLLGIFYFCIPVSLLILWLFHSVVKHPTLLLFPLIIRKRLEAYNTQFTFTPFSRLFVILCALAIGAFSHIMWDSFTHENGWAVGKLPVLQTSLFNIGNLEFTLYKLLQHSSGVFGLLLMAYCFWRWFNTKAEVGKVEQLLPDNLRHLTLVAIILLTCIIGVGIGFWSASDSSRSIALQVFVVQSIIGGMTTFALCLLIFSLAYKLLNRR